jgi:hypothetical protein
MSSVSDDTLMEIEMLRAIAGDDNVPADQPAPSPDAPASMRSFPCLRVLVARETGVPPELVLWFGFHDASYPGGGEASIPHIKVELEPNAPINHRPEEFETRAKEVALAEGGQMCLNQVYQSCVDGLVAAEEAKERAASGAAAAAADAVAAAGAAADPTIRIGNMMTSEVFVAWKTEFDAERARRAAKESAAAAKRADSPNKVRLTGKQMWDQTLKSADWKLFERVEGQDGDDDDAEDIDFVFGDEDEDNAPAADDDDGDADEENEDADGDDDG